MEDDNGISLYSQASGPFFSETTIIAQTKNKFPPPRLWTEHKMFKRHNTVEIMTTQQDTSSNSTLN